MVRAFGTRTRKTGVKGSRSQSGSRLKMQTVDHSSRQVSPEYEKILQDFKAFFGSGRVKIAIEDKDSGKGQVVIPFENHDQLTELFKCVEQ